MNNELGACNQHRALFQKVFLPSWGARTTRSEAVSMTWMENISVEGPQCALMSVSLGLDEIPIVTHIFPHTGTCHTCHIYY